MDPPPVRVRNRGHPGWGGFLCELVNPRCSRRLIRARRENSPKCNKYQDDLSWPRSSITNGRISAIVLWNSGKRGL